MNLTIMLFLKLVFGSKLQCQKKPSATSKTAKKVSNKKQILIAKTVVATFSEFEKLILKNFTDE
ncbi:hypothetical protein HHI36_010842 [Cryptolaemus montrouzieri]|uniref:Uncharacterized protein n=1 Tax=Cryptolaemus montrouzieri TaxID=559131 RepID=A0ABD2MK51_9CUCU